MESFCGLITLIIFFFSFLLFFFIYAFKNQNGKFLCLDKTFISCYLALFYGFKNQNDKFPWLNKNFVFGSSTSFLTSKPKSLCLDIWSLFFCLVYGYKIGNRNFLWDLIKTLSLDLLLCLWLQNQNHKLLWLDKTLFLVFFMDLILNKGSFYNLQDVCSYCFICSYKIHNSILITKTAQTKLLSKWELET